MNPEDLNSEELSYYWHSIAKALGKVMERAETLPEREHDSEFSEWLRDACHYAEDRADALIDPS